MTCLFGKSTNLLPSPIVARNVWGSKARACLGFTLGIVRLRSVGNVGSTGAWRAVFLLSGGPLGRRAGDIDTPICLDRHLHTSAQNKNTSSNVLLDSLNIDGHPVTNMLARLRSYGWTLSKS